MTPFELRLHGACRDEDPELFFPVSDTGSAAHPAIAEAKSICWSCPVLAQCRQWALDSAEEFGIWGGLTATERAGLRVHQTIAGLEVDLDEEVAA